MKKRFHAARSTRRSPGIIVRYHLARTANMQRATLEAWLEFLRAENHVLRDRPGLFFQQAMNQPDSTPVCDGARRRLESGKERRPWFRWVNKPQHQEVCRLTLRGHRESITACRFSVDGARIVSGSWDRTARVWDAQSGAELAVMTGHTGWITACDVSADGSRMLSASLDGTLKLWDLATGDELATLAGHSQGVADCAFSPDGRRAVSASADGTLKVWDTITGRVLVTREEGSGSPVVACDFSPDGERIASCCGISYLALTVWAASTGQVLSESAAVGKGGRRAVRFSPDGASVLTATETLTALWDAATGGRRCTLDGSWDHVAFSHDGRQIVSTGRVSEGMLVFNSEHMKLWDATTGLEVATLGGHRFGCCAFHPSGHRVVTGGGDGTLRVFDTEGWTVAGAGPESAHPSEITACAFSPDGQRIASGGGGQLRLWGGDSGFPQGSFQVAPDLIACLFPADGTRVACASSRSSEIHVRDVGTGAELAAGPGYYKTSITACELSPDRGRMAVGFKDGVVKVMDAAQAQELAHLGGHGQLPVSACAFSPDGRLVLTASWDRTLRLWDAGGRQLLVFEEPGRVMSCAFSPDGARIAAAIDVWGQDAIGLKVWEPASGRPVAAFPCERVTRCVFSADGRHVLAAAENGVVTLCDVERGVVVTAFATGLKLTPPLSASPAHPHLAYGSRAGVEVLERTAGSEFARCFPGVNATALAWSPDGRSLAVGTSTGTIRIISPE